MSNKKLTDVISIRKLILLCAIAVLAIVLVLQFVISKANDGYTLKLKDGFDKLTIQKGDAQNGESSIIIFEKSGEEWLVRQTTSEDVPAENFKADTNTCTRIEDFLNKVNVVSVVSRSSDDERYGFGENSILVTASKNGKVVRKIEIGKNAISGQQSYCKIDGSKDVVLVSGDMRQVFERDFERFKS